MKYYTTIVIAILGFAVISCNESIVEYVPPLSLHAEPSSLSLDGKKGDKNDDGTTDLSCSIDEGDWKINIEGGKRVSNIEIVSMTQKWYKNIGDNTPSYVESVDPVERLEIDSKFISKSEFPIEASSWYWFWDNNLDSFRLVRELKYKKRDEEEEKTRVEVACRS